MTTSTLLPISIQKTLSQDQIETYHQNFSSFFDGEILTTYSLHIAWYVSARIISILELPGFKEEALFYLGTDSSISSWDWYMCSGTFHIHLGKIRIEIDLPHG